MTEQKEVKEVKEVKDFTPFNKNTIRPVTQRFKLNNSTRTLIKQSTPKFGFNGLGEVVFRRTYSRNNESWHDVVIRVIEGVLSIRKEHFYRSSLRWVDSEWQDFACKMALSMFKMEWLPPGRGLWMMGTDFVYNCGSMALNNCAATDTSEDLVHSAEWTMDGLMNGVGVGFNTNWRGTASQPDKKDTELFVIPDSREGWTQSLIKLMCSYINSPLYGKNKFPEFDYSVIRPAGQPIKGFGGIASGPGPLKKMHKRIEQYLDNFCNGYIIVGDGNKRRKKEYNHTRLVADIFNSIGACVVAGNVRRCLPGDALVYTKRGLVPIKDIEVGENVLTSKGYDLVTNKFIQDEQELIKINTQDGDFRCTPNHRMAVHTEYNEYKWVEAAELKPGDRLITSKRPIHGQRTFLPESKDIVVPVLDEDIAWLIGLFQINGYTCLQYDENNEIKDNSYVNVVIELTDYKLANKVKEQLERFGNLYTVSPRKRKNIFNIHCKSTKLALYFDQHIKKNNGNIRVPEWIKMSTLNIKLAYAAGISDASGYLDKQSGQLVNSVDEKFIRDLQNVLYSCGIQTKLNLSSTDWPSNEGWKKFNTLELVTKRAHKLFSKIPQLFKDVSRIFSVYDSYDKQDENDFFNLTEVINITTDSVVQTFDIEVKSAHEFYCNGYLTHNSAEICLGNVEDKTFINLKNYEENPERGEIGWMSNNSVILQGGHNYEDFSYIPDMASRISDNGEPGMINMYNIQKYGRYGKDMNDDATLVNPCGEIALENYELCNLAECFPPRCNSSKEFYNAIRYATFYSSTVSLLPTHRPETNAVIAKNRRIGVSISGIAQWASGEVPSKWGPMNYTKMTTFLRNAYKIIKEENKHLAKQAGVPASVRVTTVKPSGSISLLAGVTPGVHYPVSRYAIRRMRIAENSPLVQPLKDAGVKWEKDIYSDRTLVFEFVIDHGDVRPCEEVSPWEQFSLMAMIQRAYSDNCVSATIYFDKDKDKKDVEKLLAMFIPVLKSVSMLPHNNGVYAQAPYEKIDRETYLRRRGEYTNIDFGSVKNNVPVGSKYCSGDKCEFSIPDKK